jgi:succinate-semialdehyde dehydrogenase/glutarate-semialdehyde dehydrogenase
MITRKVAPALASGCTVVVKAPRLTPLSALALAELSVQAGIPAGVFNVITSSRASEIGKELCTNPIVKKISFTGSTEVGKQLLKLSASTVKKMSLELGGNAPFIVFEDADLDEAVQGLIDSKFRNAGQTCVCSNRILVHESIHDLFSEKLHKALDQLNCGDGFDPDVQIGPLIESKALQFVDDLITDAVDGGAKLLRGGKRLEHPVSNLIFEPTLLTDVNEQMRVFKEEIFGPLVPLVKFKTESEALELSNATPFGLASYFFTQNHNRVIRVSEGLEFGMVGVNTGKISTTLAPFGGIKESGFGREGSKYGMDEYLQIKYVCSGGL